MTLILSEIAVGNTKNQTQLEAWNTQLIQWGAKLMQARWAMVNDMNEILKANYTQVSSQPDPLRIEYMPNVACDAPETAKICLEQKLADISGKEKWRGTSLAGPHRDEFVFYIGSRDIRRYGSRGEHKSVLVSLKAAESRFLHRASGTPPIILLDDLYAELDNDRAGQVMSLFKDKSQVFVTGTSLDYKKLFTSSEAEESGVYFVENGVVSKQ
ncbi:MAG: hypothetical protein U5R06_22605 [candidate division KSB1 bacterium]|nr:hypothetical protein [candidate division KSB1 bacterium]